jgi:hypothetical protein
MERKKKINERQMLSRFQVGQELLPPLIVKKVALHPKNDADARIDSGIKDQPEQFRFVVESKSVSTPRAIRAAVEQARRHARNNEAYPLIQVPFLSPQMIRELEKERVSGVDLCGNGVVIIPERLYIVRTGRPNQYPDSRPLNNPYRGRSALVARTLLIQPRWESLTALVGGIRKHGVDLSISQVSKAIAALVDELIVVKKQGMILLSDPLRLLDKLSQAWSGKDFTQRQTFRVHRSSDWPERLSASKALKWSATGESSVGQYTTFSQSGPIQVAVSDFSLAQSLLQAEPESVTSFADIELCETSEESYYFANSVVDNNMRYANRVQTWIELSRGDARQQVAAQDIHEQLFKEISKWPTT